MFFNDKRSPTVPQVVRASKESPEATVLQNACLDPGYPLPRKIWQAQFMLPKGMKWEGPKLKAEIQAKRM